MTPNRALLCASLTLAAVATSDAQTPTVRPTFQRRGVGTKAFPDNARGRRIAFGDVDRDGDPDLLLSGRLLINDGQGNFSWARGKGLPQKARAAIFLDYDHDGDLDVFTTGRDNSEPDRLYRNDTARGGPIQFKNVSQEIGANLRDRNPGEGVAAGDLNGDGRPDIYVANYEKPGHSGTQDRLYLSVGKRRYRDASDMGTSGRAGRGVTIADFDRDGDQDIYVSNYRLDGNVLWVNRRAETGTFSLSQRARDLGVEGNRSSGGSYGHTIGSVFGDIDNDDDIDLIAANLAHPRYLHFSDPTQVMLNRDGRFSDTEARPGDPAFGIKFEESHSNPTLFDADNDGDLDLHLTSAYDDAFLYRNRLVESRRLTFSDVTEAAGVRTYRSWGAAAADVDNDGDLDLMTCNGEGKPILFRNELPPRFKSVRVRLVGTRSDTWGAGATVILLDRGGAVRQVRQITLGHGTSSQSEPIAHFGVGKAKGPFRVRVLWPSGARTWTPIQAHVRGDAPLKIREPGRGKTLVRVDPR